MQTLNNWRTVWLRRHQNTQNSQTLQIWINIAFSWQGVIDHRPTWDSKMKTAGVFPGGGCRVTERCARWWNRQAGEDIETRAFSRPRTLRDETRLKRLWMQQLSPLLLPWKSVTSVSHCFEIIFNWGFGGVLCQLQSNMPWPVLRRCLYRDYVATTWFVQDLCTFKNWNMMDTLWHFWLK